MDLAFVLVKEARYPEPAAYVASCERRGLALVHRPEATAEPMGSSSRVAGTCT